MRILHVITGLNVGGAEKMLYRLVSSMDARRFQSRVVSLLAPGPMGEKIAAAGVPLDSLGMTRGLPTPLALWKLVRLVRDYRPDILQTWLYHGDLAGLVAAKMAFPLGGGPKIVWNIRCSFMALEQYRRLTGVTLRACTALSGFPDVILTNSHEARRFHTELGYRAKRFEVIPNGFDLERFRPDREARQAVREELSIGPETVLIGQVARFDAMKDHETMVSAAAKVAEQGDVVFVLAGKGVNHDNLDLIGWMKRYGLAPEKVRLLGQRDDISRLMAALDVHVLTSTGESFPNVVGESMACGVPNVVTDVGDSSLLVGETGLVVPPASPDALAEALRELVSLRAERRAALGLASRKRMEESYGLRSIVRRYAALYEELVEIE